MYRDKVKVGPIWTDLVGDMEYCVSPAVTKVLAWRRRDGDTVAGNWVERLAPDVVMARLMSGTASSILVRSFLICLIIACSSSTFRAFDCAFELPFRARSSWFAAMASR